MQIPWPQSTPVESDLGSRTLPAICVKSRPGASLCTRLRGPPYPDTWRRGLEISSPVREMSIACYLVVIFVNILILMFPNSSRF